MTDWIAEARARCDAATPGPWRLGKRITEVWADRDTAGWDAHLILTTETRLNPDGPDGTADQEFIAAARTDLPRALDALERVQEFLAEYVSPVDVVDEDSFNHGVDRAVAMVRAALDGDA